jgi:hypothetical protein
VSAAAGYAVADLVARAVKLAAAAGHAVAAEYRRQRHPERGWFYYARIGAGEGTHDR